MNTRTLPALALALALGAAPADAQLFNSPTFMPPAGNDGLSAYLVDGDGIELGLAGAWRGFAGSDFGVRVGFYDLGGTTAFSAGIETWRTIMTADDAFPLDVAWTAAGGAAFSDAVTTLWVPAGATVGRTFVLEQVTLQPYVHPQVGLQVHFFDAAGVSDTDMEIGVQIDIGAEIALQERWKLRVAFAAGDADALGVGAAFRF